MEKERFLAFTDAIIAIIATIMVLEFKTPDKSGWPALAELTIPLLAYALSFFMIMTVWYNHHQLYRDIKNITPRIFLLNTLWLFIMSFFPFTTGWVGKHASEFLPEFFYLIVIFLWAAVFHLMDHELLKENPDKEYKELTHSLSGRNLFLINFLSLGIVWFWPPIGLVCVAMLATISLISFLKK